MIKKCNELRFIIDSIQYALTVVLNYIKKIKLIICFLQ